MGTKQDQTIGRGDSGIPEFENPTQPTLQEKVEQIERNIAETFLIERDTSLADGAGAPGTTGLGNYEKPRNRS